MRADSSGAGVHWERALAAQQAATPKTYDVNACRASRRARDSDGRLRSLQFHPLRRGTPRCTEDPSTPTHALRDSFVFRVRQDYEQSKRTIYRPVEVFCDRRTRFGHVPLHDVNKFLSRSRRESTRHASSVRRLCPAMSARTSANTCTPGMSVTRPVSMSAKRRAISASHSGCNGDGGTTLATSVSINASRSLFGSFNASVAIPCSVVVIAFSERSLRV